MPDPAPPVLLVHALTRGSFANGPGRRLVIHTQGCSLHCPGCFNPLTHPARGGTPYPIPALLALIQAEAPDGVTLSGGEPTDQLEAVTALCQALHDNGMSVLMFSGRTLEAIQALPLGPTLLKSLDVLIDGPYERGLHSEEGLAGSSNQRMHLLSPRHTLEELGLQAVEVIIDPSGQVRVTGFPSKGLARALKVGLEGERWPREEE